MVKILFCGDFVANHPQSIKIDSEVQRIFDKCDVKACNFEAPIVSNDSPIKKSGPSLCQSEQSPCFLEKLGFNAIQLSNNHLFDFGKEGYETTKKSFQSSLLIGAGVKDEAYQIKSIKVGELQIGLMSLTHYEFGTLGFDSTEKDYGCAWINHPLVNKKIIENRDKFDYLFILPHAGIEEIDAPLPEWRQRYKEFIDLGADGVIASHPHVPQGWEIYKDKPIFFGMKV